MSIKVTIWHEFFHEKESEQVRSIYPDGMHAAIKSYLQSDENLDITLTSLYEPECGMPDELLKNTDVLIWWGHLKHDEVPDELARKIQDRVLHYGMGFIPLHSAHYSKPFRLLMGTSGRLNWGDDQKEIIWTLMPAHQIAEGIPEHFELEAEEMYGEYFDIPQPDELVFAGWFKHGNLFRSGCCFYRGRGRVFYFQPGHEYCRSYHNPYVIKIIRNAIYWAAPRNSYESDRPMDYYKKLVD